MTTTSMSASLGKALPRPRRKAVSLLEALVSLACVVTLSALLFPGLEEIRRSSKETRCMSNLGRIAGASSVYGGLDSRERLIPVHPLVGILTSALGEVEWGGKSGIGEPQSGSDVTSSKWGTQLGRGPASRFLNDVMFRGSLLDFQENPGPNNVNWLTDAQLKLDVYRCPADYGYTGSHLRAWRDGKRTSYDHYGNSYSANTLWAGVTGANCKLVSMSPFLQSASAIPAPARTILYEEHCARFAWHQNYGVGSCAQTGQTQFNLDATIRGWHDSPFTFNVSFADGHVERAYMNGLLFPQPILSRYPDWRGSPTNYDFWRCATIRDVDWQRDTLPAPPIETQIPCQAGPLTVVVP